MSQRTKESERRLLRSASCPSISGKSTLSYELACGPSGDLHVRIVDNTGAGMYSKDWISWARVVDVLDRNRDKPITAHSFSTLFKGVSVNTAGFLLAALKQEGLVRPMEDRPRCHEAQDPAAFLAALDEVAATLDPPVKLASVKAAPRGKKVKAAAAEKEAVAAQHD